MEDLCLIDDIDEAAKHCSALGRLILEESLQPVRRAIDSALAKHNWTLVKHASFRSWIGELIDSSKVTPFILDPLLNLDIDASRSHRLRISRKLSTSTGQLELVCLSNFATPASGNVEIVDDTSASGRTIAGVVAMLAGRECGSSGVALCTSSEESRRLVLRKFPWIKWRTMLVGNWRTLHLRDIFPLLPYSGRLVDLPSAALNGHAKRVCPVLLSGSSWQVLFIDSNLRATVKAGHDRALTRLARELGREPRVRDLDLLGCEIGVVSSRREGIDLTTTLTDLRPFNI